LNLQITTQVAGNQLQVVATLLDFSPLPTGNVFLYQNTGTTTLGVYMGVANVQELTAYQVWTGVAIPVFANSYVLSDKAVVNIVSATSVEQPLAAQQMVQVIQQELAALKLAYSTSATTQVIAI
jgi:hypothetical protein